MAICRLRVIFCALLAAFILTACFGGGTDEQQQEDVRTSSVAPFTEEILSVVSQQYRIDAKSHKEWAQRCIEKWEVFQQAEQLTGYPAAFLAGMASHESMGCKTSAKDWAGGRGVMQITSPPTPAQKKRVAAMLGIKVSKLDWTRNDLHSVLMGAVFLTDYESELGSRPHGLLAYNMGAGGVRKHARMTGWKSGALPSLLTIAPHLRYERRMKPRTYVWRVLTHVVLIDRLKNGLQIEMNRGIVPADIPGWDPRDDIH